MIFEVHGRTDRGLKREGNEDAFLIADLDTGARWSAACTVNKARGDSGLLCAVSDGMGGARAGEVASQMALDVVLEALRAAGAPARDPESRLRQSILRANDAVFRRSEADVACHGMGTTFTGVVVAEQACFLGHVGDSRAYLHHEGVLRQLTRDHSLMNFLVDYGVMSSDQAEALVNRNIILEALGVKRDVSVDTGSLSLVRGDTILLCTDGLYATVSDAEIHDRLAAAADLEAAADSLIEEANRRGGPDNITVVLCRLAA